MHDIPPTAGITVHMRWVGKPHRGKMEKKKDDFQRKMRPDAFRIKAGVEPSSQREGAWDRIGSSYRGRRMLGGAWAALNV